MKEVINNLRNAYNLEIDSPFLIEVNGKEIEFDCLIKGYGATKGMIVDSKWEKFEPVADTLVELGYGVSCFEIAGSSIEEFDETLDDWGKTNA